LQEGGTIAATRAVRQLLRKSGAIEGDNIAKGEGMDLGEGFAMVNTKGVAMTTAFLTGIFIPSIPRSMLSCLCAGLVPSPFGNAVS
jgi:hypothetical protein